MSIVLEEWINFYVFCCFVLSSEMRIPIQTGYTKRFLVPTIYSPNDVVPGTKRDAERSGEMEESTDHITLL